MESNTEMNRRYWDQLASIHPKTAFYKLEEFKRGESILDPLEREILGDVAGKRLLQLQCHFGLETLSLARMGAEVTGLDFSPVAIETARQIPSDLGIAAEFVEADVLNAPVELTGFDIVFASWGALCWISDIQAWMRTAARALKPGGRLIIVETHPIGTMLDLEAEPGSSLVVRYPYSSREPVFDESQASYADPDAVLDSPRCAA
jgi:ubiquinone/menaquinone biosynthesis C-methylase UbiE